MNEEEPMRKMRVFCFAFQTEANGTGRPRARGQLEWRRSAGSTRSREVGSIDSRSGACWPWALPWGSTEWFYRNGHSGGLVQPPLREGDSL